MKPRLSVKLAEPLGKHIQENMLHNSVMYEGKHVKNSLAATKVRGEGEDDLQVLW